VGGATVFVWGRLPPLTKGRSGVRIKLQKGKQVSVRGIAFGGKHVNMAMLKVESGPSGMVRVALQHFSQADLAQIKQIPGRRWDPERKQWLLPDTPETRAALAEIVATPPQAPLEQIAVAPRSGVQPGRKARASSVPGKPLMERSRLLSATPMSHRGGWNGSRVRWTISSVGGTDGQFITPDRIQGRGSSLLDPRHQSVGKHTKIGCCPTVSVVKCKFAVMPSNQQLSNLP